MQSWLSNLSDSNDTQIGQGAVWHWLLPKEEEEEEEEEKGSESVRVTSLTFCFRNGSPVTKRRNVGLHDDSVSFGEPVTNVLGKGFRGE
jgi:hypothetical protein